MKKLIIISISLILVVSSYLFIDYNVSNNTQLFQKYKNVLFSSPTRKKIRSVLTKINTFFVYNKTSFKFKKREKNINLDEDISKGELHLYTNTNLVTTGPRAYFTTDNENLYLITGTGILMSTPIKDISEKNKEIEFNTIKTNLNDFIGSYKDGGRFFSKTSIVKSLLFKNDLFYVSIIQKLDQTCFKHVILQGNQSKEKIMFEEFFQIDKCRHFYLDYVGGNLASYKDNKILYTVGDWGICEDPRWLKKYEKGYCTANSAQSMSSALGKIFEINLDTKESNIISIGHDNPQGIIYDAKTNIIYSTEHGPKDGGELNININPSVTQIKNYGYPISSYGEHYGYPAKEIMYKYDEAPFYKSHKDYGFLEPLDYYVPSIGPSDIEKIDNTLLVASMGGDIKKKQLSLHVYTLDETEKDIKSRKVFPVFERIRDIHVLENYVVLFLETTGTIGIYKRNF